MTSPVVAVVGGGVVVVVGVLSNALGVMVGRPFFASGATNASSQFAFSLSEIHFLIAMTCAFKPAASWLLSFLHPSKQTYFGDLYSLRGFNDAEFRTFEHPLQNKCGGNFLMSKQVTQLRGEARVRLGGTGVTPSWSTSKAT